MSSIKASILTLSLVLVMCNVPLAATDSYSLKLDEFDGTNWEDAMARLDNLAITLSNEPGSIGVLIVYGGRRGRRGEAQAWGKCLRDYMVNSRGVSANRVVLVDGGFRDAITAEIWKSAGKQYIPTPAPTVDPKDVRFRKGKIKGWRSLCNI